jgi:molybdopterin-guanine dinucleotide biosynthesis protein A
MSLQPHKAATHVENSKVSWVILAGGQASRMNGNDKGLVTLAGKPLIEYVYQTLSAQTDSIFINANRNLDFYRQYAPTFSDQLDDYPGPLGGIHAALKQIDSEWIGFVPCDCPKLPENLVESMISGCHENTDIAVAHDGESLQPVVTIFNKRVLPLLEQFLNNGDRKIILLYKLCNTVEIDFSQQSQGFINLNTPSELQQYGELL